MGPSPSLSSSATSCWRGSPRRAPRAGGSSSSAARRGWGRHRSCARSRTASSATLFVGSCESLTTPTPLGPFVDVAAQVGGELAELVGSGADTRSVALAVLEELRRPAVLVLEDLHWADEASLDVLRVLGRRIDGVPEWRSRPTATTRWKGHPLARVLGELASAPGVERLSVPRLSAEAVRTLAEPTGAEPVALYELTGGNCVLRDRGARGRRRRSASNRARRGARAGGGARAVGAAVARRCGARALAGRALADGDRRARRRRRP